jgi:hypothetical protein
LQFLMSGLRHLPRPVFRKVVDVRDPVAAKGKPKAKGKKRA